ncbi:ribosome-associated protein [Terracoccus luteus]|uniref:Ribosome-associated protein n=1 Tax=Terracoccus luteus TaxID=53356 RepID=A0A495XVN4_9MICO|nr:ribosome-associated protein [Terracoccus luteus]
MDVTSPGADLVVAPGPGLRDGLVVPAADLLERFSRSSGPGGQGVNTTDSRVELVLDLTTTSALTDTQRERALRSLGGRYPDGRVTVVASEHRAQLRNRAAARQRLAGILREALAPPPPARRATKPTRGSQRRRLAGKQQRSEVKATRRRPGRDD